MAAKIIVLATALAACNAVPIWYNELPGVVMRIGRSPSISYGFGSGFSSNIGGISHSTGIGAAFSSGGGQAGGYGIGSGEGAAYARGVGIANSNSHPVVQYYHQPTYQSVPRTSYESSVASTTNIGNYGNAVSSAQSRGGSNFGSAVSSAQSGGPDRINSAVASAQNVHGYESALASTNSGYGSALSSAYGSSVSSAQTKGYGGYGGYGSAVSAAENTGRYQASTAQVNQLHAGGDQSSAGATSINAPGFQAAQSHAVNTGFLY